jgi:hypothetical protein
VKICSSQRHSSSDLPFASLLEELGNGAKFEASKFRTFTSRSEAENWFSQISGNHFATDGTFLSFYNRNVQKENEEVLAKLFTREKIATLEAAYFTNNDGFSALSNLRDMTTLSDRKSPPHKLQLAIGAPVMLLRNLLPSQGLANGSILTVKSISQGALICLDKHGREQRIPRIPFAIKRGVDTIYRIQFPVALNREPVLCTPSGLLYPPGF